MTRRGLLVDLVIALLLVIAGATIASTYRSATARRIYFFEWEIIPATVSACGGGFRQPNKPLPALSAFAVRQTETFDCDALKSVERLGPASGIASQNLYGLLGPAVAMAINGVSWRSLDLYIAVLYGLATALSYAFLRFFSWRVVAIAGTLMMALSHRVAEILSHRDYIKEPPFLAMLVIMTWLVVRERPRRDVWRAAAIGGLVLGIGIGCRADLMIIAPFFAAVLLLFVPWAAAEGTLRHRAIALALFAAGFAVTATPILRSASGGSNLSHTLLMGFMRPFTTHLGLQVPAYDLGTIYSDGYTYTLIAAQARLREGDQGQVLFGLPEYDAAGARLFADIARKFPADMLARSYGAVLESLARPYKHESLVYSRLTDGFQESALVRPLANWRYATLFPIEQNGIAFMIAALVIAAAANLRVAILAAATVIYFCAYTMLQFSPRHTFHLDLFGFAALTFLAQAVVALVWSAVRWRRPMAVGWGRAALNVVAFIIFIAVVVSGPLWLLRWWQQDSVTNMLAATLAASGTPTPFALEPFDDKSVLVKSDQLGQRIGPGPTKDLRDVRMDYIVATFNGAACGSEPFEVGLKYTGVVTSADKEFNRSFTVTPPAPGHSVRILTPLFNEYGPYWVRADGLLLPPDRAQCLTAMTRAQAPGALPMPFLYATLAEDWRGSPLYQRFRWE